MFGLGTLHVGPGDVGSGDLETHGDDLDPLRAKLLTQGLPPGQVEGAASVGCPGDEHHLAAQQ